MRHAMANRDRLSEVERGVTVGTYYTTIDNDPVKAIHAFQAVLELEPANQMALDNLATLYENQRQFGSAAELYRRAIPFAASKPDARASLVQALVRDDRVLEARRELDSLRTAYPNHPTTRWT